MNRKCCKRLVVVVSIANICWGYAGPMPVSAALRTKSWSQCVTLDKAIRGQIRRVMRPLEVKQVATCLGIGVSVHRRRKGGQEPKREGHMRVNVILTRTANQLFDNN